MRMYINALYRTLRAIAAIILKGCFCPNIKEIKINKDNATCFILGNGPSLSKELSISRRFLDKQDLFVVNHFALSDYFIKLKPKYYIFADPEFWDKNVCFEAKSPNQSTLDVIIKETYWQMKIIVPYIAADKFKKKFRLKSNIGIYYYSTVSLETGTKIDDLFYSKFLASPILQNVLVSAIFLSINIGYKNVYLLGADHSWIEEIRVNSENAVCLMDKHFYEKDAVLLKPWLKLYGGVYKMHEILIDLSKMFLGYHTLNKYGKSRNVKIINCTKNSYIDAFERRDLNEFIQ